MSQALASVQRLECGCNPDGLCHVQTCHDPLLAGCGEDLTDSNECSDPENCQSAQCMVCADLEVAEERLPSWAPCTCPCCLEIPDGC